MGLLLSGGCCSQTLFFVNEEKKKQKRFVYLLFCLFCLSCLFACLLDWLVGCLFVCLFVRLFIRLFVFVCLSVRFFNSFRCLFFLSLTIFLVVYSISLLYFFIHYISLFYFFFLFFSLYFFFQVFPDDLPFSPALGGAPLPSPPVYTAEEESAQLSPAALAEYLHTALKAVRDIQGDPQAGPPTT